MKKLLSIVRSDSGFSLIEIVVALAIGSLIMIMIQTAHKSILTSVRSVTENAQFYETVNLAIRRISRDIECAIYRQDNRFIIFKGENHLSPPKRGQITFVTVNSSEFAASGDLKSEYRETDVKTVQYSLRPDKKFPGLFFLMRADKNLYETREEDDTSAPLTQYETLVLENVTDIDFEFSSGGSDWSAKWDSPGVPWAVRTTLKAKNFRGKEEIFIFTCVPAAARKDFK